MRARDIARSLSRHGAVMVQQVGGHQRWIYTNPVIGAVCASTLPVHPGDISPGVVRSISKAFEPAFGKGWL